MKKGAIFMMIINVSMAFATPEFGPVAKLYKNDTSAYILVKKFQGIELFEKWDAIDSNISAREIKVVFSINTEIRSAALLLQNEIRGTKWNKNASVYKIIKADNHWIGYIQYDLPWPLHNQDCVLQYIELPSPDSLTIAFKSVDHPLFPEQKNVDRINGTSGKWILTKKPKGIQVEYFITTTPSKILPAWMTDPIIRNNLLSPMKEFREILEK
ncbi:MAG: START domain-containing protein [Cyclobacteriaceae bacterium]